MATVQKFNFGVDFDAPETPLPEAPEDADFVEDEIVPVPSFSEEEMAEACATALAQGRAEAAAEARESTEHLVAESLAAIRAQFDEMGQTVAAALLQREQDAVALAATIARKVLPEVARYGAVEALEAFVADCMEQVREEPRLVVRVNEALAEPLRGRMGEIAADSGYPGDIAVLADEVLPITDCHIEWGEGGTDYKSGQIWAEIDGLVQSFLDSYSHAAAPAAGPGADDIAAGEAPDGTASGEETL